VATSHPSADPVESLVDTPLKPRYVRAEPQNVGIGMGTASGRSWVD
jgi:hypothetical protein